MLVVAFLLLALAAALGLWAATTVTERTKTNVTAENTENLGPHCRVRDADARGPAPAPRRFARPVGRGHSHHQGSEREGRRAGPEDGRRGAARGDPRRLTAARPRAIAPFATGWTRLHRQRKARAAEGDHLPTLGVMLVADADTGEPPVAAGSTSPAFTRTARPRTRPGTPTTPRPRVLHLRPVVPRLFRRRPAGRSAGRSAARTRSCAPRTSATRSGRAGSTGTGTAASSASGGS